MKGGLWNNTEKSNMDEAEMKEATIPEGTKEDKVLGVT